MVDRDRVLDVAVDFAQRLIGAALKPEHPSERNPCCHALIELETNNVRPIDRRRIATEHALDALTRAGLVSHEMQRRSRHTVSDPLVGVISFACREAAGLLS